MAVQATTLFEGESLSVYRLRCDAGPADRPFLEVHARHSLSYVRRGSFGCRTLGAERELVPGAVMVGRSGQEYMATHERHGGGDECISLKFSPQLSDSLARKPAWDLACLPPLAEVMVLGELMIAAAEGRAGVGIEEAALRFAATFARMNGRNPHETRRKVARRCVVAAALWLEAHASEAVTLEAAAREAGLSPFHFLRVFSAVVGATPHQYLLRLRLARAAKLLSQEDLPVTDVALDAGFADLSNFVRTFRRASGVSPREFRRASKGERKILQERIAAAA